MENLASTFSISSEVNTFDKESTMLEPLTELQLAQIYGEGAKVVMERKKAKGLTRADPNCPGKELFLMMKDLRLETNLDV